MTIGKLFHLTHIADDFAAVDEWYDHVFAVKRGFMDKDYDEGQMREASLVVLGDSVIEPIGPARHAQGWQQSPLARFLDRCGSHWHSIAWYTDDLEATWKRLSAAGLRTMSLGGGTAADRPTGTEFVTHPRSTIAMLEFSLGPKPKDIRFEPGYDPTWWASSHPLGLEYLHSTTLVTNDLDRAQWIFADVLGGRLVGRHTSGLTGTRNALVLIGDTFVDLAEPVAEGLAGTDLQKNGEIHHSVTWKVRDVEAASRYLVSVGVSIIDRDQHTLIADPDTTHGALMLFTEAAPPRV